ncbi:MAG: AAA family ATPase, partial [Gammaproteobacteria bacterium]|nr:AAA family ATPase [Gammaproteobacteria bacterium]
MLTEITVRNYAVIAATTLELGPGMTVLTGSTGAGKSIIVGALGLVLGQRADSGIVRDGAERAEISAHFDVDDSVLTWLKDNELDADDECLVRRVVSREGRSRAWINGHAVTLQSLRELGAQLVDIHGQHANQTLTRRADQRAILDSFAANHALRDKVAAHYDAWQAATAELEKLQAAQADRSSRLDLLRFQLQELETLAPIAGEVENLEAEQKKLAHAGRLAEDTTLAVDLLDGDSGAQSALARGAQLITALAAIDPQLQNIATMLESAEIQVSEALAELQDYASSIDIDPARRDTVEQRLQSMQALARKHMVDRNELPAKLDSLRTELDQLDNAEVHVQKLIDAVSDAESGYTAAAKKLHDNRVRA